MNFRERILQGRSELDKELEAANNNQLENLFISDFFGVEAVRQSPACIDLRTAEGVRTSLPYSHIVRMDFDESEGIKITGTYMKVVIEGRELSKLYDYLSAFRVNYIKVGNGLDIKEEGLYVEEIIIEDV